MSSLTAGEVMAFEIKCDVRIEGSKSSSNFHPFLVVTPTEVLTVLHFRVVVSFVSLNQKITKGCLMNTYEYFLKYYLSMALFQITVPFLKNINRIWSLCFIMVRGVTLIQERPD